MSREDGEVGPGGNRLLIVACGAANVINLPSYLIALNSVENLEVRVLMTRTAARIIPPETVRLFCEEVLCDGPDDFSPGHVNLASWAHQIAVIPATAHILGLLANGIAEGLVGATLLSHIQSITFFPSMNWRLWERPSIQRNVASLQTDGHNVVKPLVTSGWVIATKSMHQNPGMPTPIMVVRVIQDLFDKNQQIRPGLS